MNDLRSYEQFLKRHLTLVSALSGMGLYFLHDDGEDLKNRVFQVHSHALAEVLHQESDLEDLRAVLEDARAQARVRDQKIRDDFLGRWVSAKKALSAAFAEVPHQVGAFTELLRRSPRQALRWFALPASFRLQAYPHLGKIDSLISRARDLNAFLGVVALLPDNPRVVPGGLFPALADVKTLLGSPNIQDFWAFFRILVESGFLLLDHSIWVPKIRLAHELVPPGVAERLVHIAAAAPLGRLLAFCGPWLVSLDDCERAREALSRVLARLSRFSLHSDDQIKVLEDIFSRYLPEAGSFESYLSLCEGLPQIWEEEGHAADPLFGPSATAEDPDTPAKSQRVVHRFSPDAPPRRVARRKGSGPRKPAFEITAEAPFVHVAMAAHFQNMCLNFETRKFCFNEQELMSLLDSLCYFEGPGEPTAGLILAVLRLAQSRCRDCPEAASTALAAAVLGITPEDLTHTLRWLEGRDV